MGYSFFGYSFFSGILICSMTAFGATGLNLAKFKLFESLGERMTVVKEAVWIIFFVSDGGSITWYDSAVIETVTTPSSISSANKSLIKGSMNAELNCNFSLTTDLRLIAVSMKFGITPVATYLRSRQALSVVQGFRSRFNATWVPSRLTLILLTVTSADEGEYLCEVMTFGPSVDTWVRKIQVSLLGKPGQPVNRIIIKSYYFYSGFSLFMGVGGRSSSFWKAFALANCQCQLCRECNTINARRLSQTQNHCCKGKDSIDFLLVLFSLFWRAVGLMRFLACKYDSKQHISE